jgi:glycosyltransferase involved in cell wall biosynthesis
MPPGDQAQRRKVERGPKAEGFDPARDVLFIGLGSTPVAYYRCFLPALELGADWCGIAGDPPNTSWVTGLVDGDSKRPNMVEDYKIVVLQEPGKAWIKPIEQMREAGVKVLYEVDDYLHGIQHMKDHAFRDHFDREFLWGAEQAMKRCDGLIASTEWIAGNYSHFNKRTFVCQNGIDLRRYRLTRPPRETVNIGWAGGTGHLEAILPWLQQTAHVMRMRPQTTFISIGQAFAEAFKEQFADRAIAVPWAAIEQYPSAMTMMDIALAPGGKGGWWRGKSDLRWLEAGALGIPLIANPVIYPAIESGVTGFHSRSPQETAELLLRLVDDEELRTTVGKNAQDVVRETRSIKAVIPQWREVFDAILESDS